MAFLETPRFPEEVSAWMVGGEQFFTEVVAVQSGWEQRNQLWTMPLRRYSLSNAMREISNLQATKSFFRVAGGRANGFRVRDWLDYQANISTGYLGLTGNGTGEPTYQLYKAYASGSLTSMGKVSKPVVASVTLYRNSVAVATGNGAGQATLDTTTGIVTFTANVTKNVDSNSAKTINTNSQKTVSNITQNNPGVVTCASHGFANGDYIKLESVSGMNQVNGNTYNITVLTANTFSIGANTTSYTAYSGNGTATKYGVTQTNPVRVYATSHNFSTGDFIRLASVGGMNQVNDLTFNITVIDANCFTLGVNGTSYTARTTGGTATRHGITNTATARVYSTAHNFTNGQLVYISGATGMTEINGASYTVTNSQANYFDLSGINSVSYGAYTGSGVLGLYPQTADVLRWAGEFDIPMRFDDDWLQIGMDPGGLLNWNSVMLTELRL